MRIIDVALQKFVEHEANEKAERDRAESKLATELKRLLRCKFGVELPDTHIVNLYEEDEVYYFAKAEWEGNWRYYLYCKVGEDGESYCIRNAVDFYRWLEEHREVYPCLTDNSAA